MTAEHFLDDLPWPEGLPKTKRVKFDYEGGTIGVSVPLELEGEELEKLKRDIMAIADRVRAFDELEELDRVKYYLANAYKNIRAIMDLLHPKISLTDDDSIAKMKADHENPYYIRCMDAWGLADMALCNIPSQYKHTDIEI
jgi:hypothetical protein